MLDTCISSLSMGIGFLLQGDTQLGRVWAGQRDFCLDLDFAVNQVCDFGW